MSVSPLRLELEHVAVRAGLLVDGAVPLALVREAHREVARVAHGVQAHDLRVLVEVVLEYALLAVGVDEELAVVELLHPSVALAVLAVLEGHDAARLDQLAQPGHRRVEAGRAQVLDDPRVRGPPELVRVLDLA